MILSLFLACSDAPKEVPFNTFADVHQPQLTINAGNLVAKGWRLQVLVHPELEGVCRALPELQARLDGAPLTRLHGIYDDGTIKYDPAGAYDGHFVAFNDKTLVKQVLGYVGSLVQGNPVVSK